MSTVNVAYQPNPWQTKAHTSRATNLCLTGGLGSGKSFCGINELKACALQNPKGLYLIGRKTLPSLRDTTYRTFFQCFEEQLISEHNKANLTVKLVNGSEFIFRPLDDQEKFKSLEISGFFVDEANEIDEPMYQTLQSRVRQMIGGRQPFYRTILALNPTEEDHWIPQLFLHRKPKNHEIHFSTTFDNQANLPKDYIENLMASYTPDMQQRMIFGQFGKVHKGRPVYPQFSRGHYIRPIDLIRDDKGLPDKRVHLIRGWDFGFNSPAVVWMQHHNGQLRILAEKQGSRVYLDDFLKDVLAYEREIFGEWTGTRQEFCDPAGAQESDKGITSVQILNDANIFPAHRRTKIEEGLRAVRHFLDTAFEGEPNFLIHPRCKLVVEGMRGGYSRLDGEDLPDKTTGYDHTQDALRYAATHLYQRHRVRRFHEHLGDEKVHINPISGRRIYY